MAKLSGVSSDRMADEFVNYLFQEYRGSRHVRRVAAWIGFIVAGIEKVRDGEEWDIPRRRQLRFSVAGRKFTASYDHNVEPRGGIVIRELLPGRGSPKSDALHAISTLEEAESFYLSPGGFLAKRDG
jgi:hypothetical protein